MTAISPTAEAEAEGPAEQPAPACVMSFNVSDPSGAGGSAGDVATIAAMGAHALPVVTGIVMRDTAEIFDHHAIDADVIVEQARSVLEDVTIAAWKVGFLGSTEGVSAVAANKHGTRYVLVTSVPLPDQFLDNVLANAQGAITGEKFERFEATFVGAGETLSAGLAALLATGVELHAAVGEALAFLDQALDAGFRPGMGNVIPDRFFWALPEEEEEDAVAGEADPSEPDGAAAPRNPRHVH